MSFEIGSKVKINPSNDNDNYDSFRGMVLIVTSSDIGGRGYDEIMYPQKLMDFELLLV